MSSMATPGSLAVFRMREGNRHTIPKQRLWFLSLSLGSQMRAGTTKSPGNHAHLLSHSRSFSCEIREKGYGPHQRLSLSPIVSLSFSG